MATIGQGIITILPEGDLVTALSSLADIGGGVINLLAGTYYAESDIRVPSNVRVSGVGSGGTIIDFQNLPHQIKAIGDDPYADGTISINDGESAVSGSGTAWTEDMAGQSVFMSGQWYLIDMVDESLQHLTLDSPYAGPDLSDSRYAIATPNRSTSINSMTVRNSSVDLIRVQYAENFSGNDIASSNGLSGALFDHVSTLNYDIGSADSCGTGMIFGDVDGMTVQNSFLSNVISGGGYIFSRVTNSVVVDSSLDTCVGPGFRMTDCSDFGIDEFSVIGVTGNGIEIIGGGDGMGLISGLIEDVTGDGLSISAGASRVQTTAVQFSDNGGYGVSIAGSDSSDNSFVGNSFFDNGSGAMDDGGTGTFIRGNVGVPDNSGSSSISSSASQTPSVTTAAGQKLTVTVKGYVVIAGGGSPSTTVVSMKLNGATVDTVSASMNTNDGNSQLSPICLQYYCIAPAQANNITFDQTIGDIVTIFRVE